MTEPSHEELVYRFGGFELWPAERKLMKDGERAALTPRAFDLLVALVEADGRLVSKEALMERVWADAVVEEGNLNRTISALRKVLGEEKGDNRFIETVPKAGYRFVARVERTPSAAARKHESYAEPSAGTAASPSRKGRAVAFGAFVLIFGVLAAAYFIFRSGGERHIAAAEPPKVRRLTNSAFDEDAAYWTDDGKIRFSRLSNPGRSDSMLMNPDGHDQRIDTAGIRDFAGGIWSRDGRKVVYTKSSGDHTGYFLADSDGSNETRLPFRPGPLSWSADGAQIVVNNRAENGNSNSEIFVYTVATGEYRNVTNHPAFDADPVFSPDGQSIVFVSDRAGGTGLYSMNTDGSGVKQILSDGSKLAFPVFSPDGTQIAFNSDRENEKVGIYLIAADGGTPLKISDTSYNSEIRPGCWSPDGTKIVFTSDASGDKFNVHLLTDVEPFTPRAIASDANADIQSAAVTHDGKQLALGVKLADGRGEIRILDVAAGSTRSLAQTTEAGLAPSWSPDGRSLAIQLKAGGNTEIFSVDAASGEMRNLTNDPSRDASPTWTPDGQAIVFSSNRDGSSENSYLFAMNTDGSNVRRVLSRSGYELAPSISPDGRTVAFAGDRADGNSRALDIFIADLTDTAAERIVTKLRFHDTEPAFSPDGTTIVFTSQRDGNKEIYLVKTGGTGLMRLTRHEGDDMMPKFSSDGSSIYFVSNRSGKFALYQIELAAG
jgi:Tol biopolymer transport system component/DNA-binding winged helix-turn-helix (wHTH) protein